MSQISFAEAEYQNKKRKTRREKFLERMDQLIPWKKLEKKVARYYPKGENGRRPYPLQVMLRRCQHHLCSELDQEQRGRARSGNAPDSQRQSVALRNEDAHRRRCRIRDDPFAGGDVRQRP